MGQQSTDVDLLALTKELEAEKRKIDKELEAIYIVRRINQERTIGVDTGGRRASTYAQELTDAIYDTLSSERPLHRTAILERVTEHGIHVGGAKPINSIGSYLSTDRRFKNCGRGLWTLEEEPMTGIPSSDNDAMGVANTPPQRASFSTNDIFANAEEEPAIHGFNQDSKYAPR